MRVIRMDKKKVIERIAGGLPDWATGRSGEIRRRFRAAYGFEAPDRFIQEEKIRTVRLYALLIVLALLSLIALLTQVLSDQALDATKRADYGGAPLKVDAEVEAVYGKARIRRDVTLNIQPKAPEADEIVSKIKDLKTRLPKIILGGNQSLNAIREDMALTTHDTLTGIELNWKSDNTALIDEDGKVNLIGDPAGEEVVLSASLRLGDAIDELSIRVILGSPDADYDYSRDLEESLDHLVKSLNTNEDGEIFELPEQTDSGIKLNWQKQGAALYAAVPVALLLLGILAFRNRYAHLNDQIRKDTSSIRRDFPEFLNKLLLLLGAGMVISSAISRIAEDYRCRKRPGEERYFYEELCRMEDRLQAAGTGLAVEFADVAARSGQREVMRFSAILSDNIDKGTSLSDKLVRESEMLWALRKKSAEEAGRIAETKLTFPMALQLLVVILVTVTPAAMEMH